jgi:hypothetical protein
MAKTIMMPLDEFNFPAGYMEGNWKGDDGTYLGISKGTAVYTTLKGTKIQGKTTVKDNLLTITPASGPAVHLYFGFNQPSDALVATFTDTGSAVIYKRVAGQPQVPQQPQIPTASDTPAAAVPQRLRSPAAQMPQVPQQPQYPSRYPIHQPHRVWGAILNGQQW